MTETAGKMKTRIQAVRQWLNQAEEHFGRNAPVRGEMDLLLAEAELRSTRETLNTGHGWLQMSWIRQGIAFSLAAVISVAGLGSAWWWWQDNRTEPVPLAAVVTPVPSLRMDPAHTISAVVVQQPAPMPAATTVEAMNPGQEVKSTERSAVRESFVSQEEMKRLIQAAGQSLRGRTKP